ncbi:hypothetical protein D4R86_03070 [bacterium]|nr:MAG: hypothetical protein D4R86_03070 [bacterium]
MIYLPDVTLVCVDCLNYHKAVKAILKSTKEIIFKQVYFFTDIEFEIPDVTIISIDSIKSAEEYCTYLIKEVPNYVKSDYMLVIQWDGFVLNPYSWTDEFLEYDYIGALWGYSIENPKDIYDNGNGGFSLRSKILMDIVKNDINIEQIFPEDHHIGRTYRPYLESLGIRFAPNDLAAKFSVECVGTVSNQFGFHQPRTHEIVRL